MTVCYWCGAKDTLADVGKELDDGKYKMVQCSKCKNAYYVLNKEKMNKPKQMTNEEWFATLSTEEKAKMLGRVSFCDFCPHQLSEHCAWTTGYSEDCVYGNKENEELWLNWLKQPHIIKE